MAAPIRPAASKNFGREKYLYVPTIADISAPTVTELTAVGVLDISCYLFDGFTRPDQNTNRVRPERRVCDTKQYESIGITDYSGGDLMYAVDPQAAALSDGKKAYEKLVAGNGYLVRRNGDDVNTDVAAGDFVDVMPVELGPSIPITVGSGETAENAMKCAYAITSEPEWLVAVVA